MRIELFRLRIELFPAAHKTVSGCAQSCIRLRIELFLYVKLKLSCLHGASNLGFSTLIHPIPKKLELLKYKSKAYLDLWSLHLTLPTVMVWSPFIERDARPRNPLGSLHCWRICSFVYTTGPGGSISMGGGGGGLGC